MSKPSNEDIARILERIADLLETQDAWLPVMHVEREGWSFTILYSNTAQAHERGTTRDWVVIYYERGGRERQHTVVTATGGSLQGKRIVRGREAECRQYYGIE